MGQAKTRGTYEQRVAQAQEREAKERAALSEQHRNTIQRRGKSHLLPMLATAMLAVQPMLERPHDAGERSDG